MEFQKTQGLRRDISPKAIIFAAILAVVIVVVLLIAGVDATAMKLLLASLLFGLASYVSYLTDRGKGEVSLSQGGIAGGILMLLYFIVVVGMHSLKATGHFLPNSTLEVALFLLSALFFTLFGAGVGGMIAVIGDTAVRTGHGIVRRWFSAKAGKAKRDPEL